MNFFKFISLVICFLPLSLSFSQGITNNELSLLFEKNDQVIMYVGDIREFEANQLERAAISTPAVADITSAENDSIIVSAKDSGYTKLNWKDINGDHTVGQKSDIKAGEDYKLKVAVEGSRVEFFVKRFKR